MKLTTFFFFLIFTITTLNAQISFRKVFGGNNYDYGRSVQQTLDTGYILVGSTGSFGAGSSDVYLIKTDSVANTKWTKTYGGTGIELGYSVQQTKDTGYIVAGYTNSKGAGGYDVYLIKTNSLGDTLWTRTYGGTNWDFAYSVKQTIDEGYIIVGSTYSYGKGDEDVYLIRTNKNGDTLWTKTYGGLLEDVGLEVQLTKDSGYIISGNTKSFGAGNYDAYLIKTNNNGDTLWTKTYGGIKEEYGSSVQQTLDGGYIIGSYSNSFGVSGYDIYLIKTNTNGVIIWTRAEVGPDDILINKIIQTADSGFVTCGKRNGGGGGGYDMHLVKWNSEGYYGGIAATYGGINNEEAYSIGKTFDGGFVLVGYTNSYGPGLDNIFLIKATSSGVVTGPVIIGIYKNYINPDNEVKIYPNPLINNATIRLVSKNNNHKSEIKFNLFDLMGREVTQNIIYNTSNNSSLPNAIEVQINRGSLTAGIYVYSITNHLEVIAKGKLIVADN